MHLPSKEGSEQRALVPEAGLYGGISSDYNPGDRTIAAIMTGL